jgi:hypothetical protein
MTRGGRGGVSSCGGAAPSVIRRSAAEEWVNVRPLPFNPKTGVAVSDHLPLVAMIDF